MRLSLVAGCTMLVAGISAGWQGEKAVSLGVWKSYTDMRSVRAVAAAGNEVWAATGGGLFGVLPGTVPYIVQFTNSEGLNSNDLTALHAESNGRLWIGSREGFIDVLESDRESWKSLRDIQQSTRIQKKIRTFTMQNDSLLVGTDFGVTVFLVSRWEFGDTYGNFGFSSQAGVNGIAVWNNRLWIATDQGVAAAPLNSPNLSSPTAWTRYQTGQGLPSNATTSVAIFHDTLVVGTSSGGAFYDGTQFQGISSLAGKQVVSVNGAMNQMRVLSTGVGSFEISYLDFVAGSIVSSLVDPSDSATSFAGPSQGIFWTGTSSSGIKSPTQSIIPNGPASSLFSSLAVDPNGVLWCASGISGRGQGFYRFDPGQPETLRWKSFRSSSSPVMLSDDYYKVSLGVDGRMWVSSWGRGVVEVVADTIRRRFDAFSNPSFSATVFNPSDPNFVVVGSVATDEGTSWFVNRTALSGNYLARLVSDSSFSYYTNVVSPGQGTFTSMVIDRNGTKWLANAEPFNKPATGLYYFNENNDISGTQATGGWGFMTMTDGMPNNTVLSLAVDLTGDVYVGTDLGLMVITEPLFPKQRRYTSFPLREQSIQAISVDAVNNKWIGTKEGVFVMNADATQIVQHYSVLTTGGRMIDNDIRTIAIDQYRGVVYIGTEKGLSSLTIAPVATERGFPSLSIGPNPYLIPSGGDLVIRNLVAESSIKVLSIDGSVVSEFKAQGGGRAFWNGRDSKGKLVGSGIYIIVAFAENGNQIATGKVAIVRR